MRACFFECEFVQPILFASSLDSVSFSSESISIKDII